MAQLPDNCSLASESGRGQPTGKSQLIFIKYGVKYLRQNVGMGLGWDFHSPTSLSSVLGALSVVTEL